MCVSPSIVGVNTANNFRVSAHHVPSSSLHYRLVPCGHCLECLQKYQNDWKIRLYEEYKLTHKAVFFTLTYAPEKAHNVDIVDEDSGEIRSLTSVCKRDVQLWLKRCRQSYRRKYGKDASFRYFITSEYGPRTLRAHYHGIFLGIDISIVFSWLQLWQRDFGYVNYSKVSDSGTFRRYDKSTKKLTVIKKNPLKVMDYVSKYCCKGSFENPYCKSHPGSVSPTFHLLSKGLGLSYIFSDIKNKTLSLNAIRHYCTDSLQYNHHLSDFYLEEVVSKFFYRFPSSEAVYSLPRYYKNALFLSKSRYQTELSSRLSSFILARTDDIYLDKCRQIQSERNCTDFEAVRLASRLDYKEKRLREENIRKRLALRYDKSVI